MKNISLFASDKIRMHPNDTTVDGLGIAAEPYLILPLDVSDEELEKAIRQCLEKSRADVPHRPWQKEETAAYYKQLGVRSHRDLGRGTDIKVENGRYTVTPVDKRGLFGEPVEVKEEELVKTIQECMGLLPAKTE
ncbi:MAG: hypothetical protein H6556_13580 [Lewinellaceae bacterium]|nr:hypothetical protein [Lewinellaceae bacterium]